jgi:hypothetical protein
MLTISVAQQVEGLAVTRDSLPIDAQMFGVAVPVDPGEHTVAARAPKHRAWTKKMVIAAGPQALTVVVPALEALPEPPPAAETDTQTKSEPESETAAPAGSTLPDTTAGASPDSGSTMSTAGVVIAGVGVAAMGVATAFGVVAIKRKDASSDAADGGCNADNLCTADGLDLRDRALSAAHVSTALFAVGAAAVVSGGIMYLLAGGASAAEGSPKAARSWPRLAVYPVADHGAVFSIGGVW